VTIWIKFFRLWFSVILMWLIQWELHIFRQFSPRAVLSALFATALCVFRPRIHGELLKLGIDVGETSVSKYMVHRPPSRRLPNS
jgi:hypothetical protein